MAPLSKAIKTELKATLKDGTQLYECIADPQWSAGAVTFGGYSIGLVLDATQRHQASSAHPDAIHISSQFLRAATPGVMQIKISELKTGSRFTNLTAELYQKNTLKATFQLIFGNFDQMSSSAMAGVSIPTSHAPLHPFVAHPAEVKLTPHYGSLNFETHHSWARDDHFGDRNSREGRNVDGLLAGAWFRLHESPEVKMSPTYIPFFVDSGESTWHTLPKEHTQGRHFWHPSLSITIEFKCRLPLSPEHASHTLGVFGWKRHLRDGLWNDSTEVWSAPSELGDPAKIDANRHTKIAQTNMSTVLAVVSPLSDANTTTPKHGLAILGMTKKRPTLAGSAAAKGTPTVDQALEPRQAAFTPLASQHFNYDSLPYQADTGTGERGTQFGYNICNSTTEGAASKCQTAIINSLDDFCIWGPPEPNSVVGNTEGEAVAWCTKPGHGTRVIPQGAITGAQFMRTKDYIQITGHINQALINMTPDDGGGEMDPHGADQRGNPLGGLVFTNAWGAGYTQVIEWHNFMGDNLFCLKACDPAGPNAARYCEHIFDRIGCWYNAPAAYLDGEFSSCLGESQDFPGIYTGAD
ncbi:hypothetical protein FRC01_001558, partial [Tulasnella sp. 417]